MADAEGRLAEQSFELEARAIELAGREGRIDDLERVATVLSQRVVERERELRRLRVEAAGAGGGQDEAIAELAAVARELDAVRRQARGQATRMRLRALRDAAEVGERIAELSQRPVRERERLFAALAEAIRRVGEGDGRFDGGGEDAASEIFAGLVEVEIGPLSDFSKLVGFEDAASGIGAAAAISVKRFTQGRATLEMSLREPVALLRELEERAPFEFEVRDRRFDRLVLDVAE